MWISVVALVYALIMGAAVLAGASPWPWLIISFTVGMFHTIPTARAVLGVPPRELGWFMFGATLWAAAVAALLAWFWGSYPSVAATVQLVAAVVGLVALGGMRVIPPLRC